MPPLTVSTTMRIEEVVIVHGDDRFIVRREEHPDIDGAFLTSVIRSEVVVPPGGDDITLTTNIATLDDPGGPLIDLAREWALTMPGP